MHSSFDNRTEAESLLEQMKLGNEIVGVRFAKSQAPTESTFFNSLEDATGMITSNLLDEEVNGFWVGITMDLESALRTLLLELNERRAFSDYVIGSDNFKMHILL